MATHGQQSISCSEPRQILRKDGDTDFTALDGLDVYWSDLVRMFEAFRRFRDKDLAALTAVREKITSVSYHPFVDLKIEALA